MSAAPATPSATRVPEPTVDTTYPSASSCSYAETTRPRDTPSWSASCRVEGRRSPERSRPARIAVRRAAWTCCPSGTSADRSTASASSGTTPEKATVMRRG